MISLTASDKPIPFPLTGEDEKLIPSPSMGEG